MATVPEALRNAYENTRYCVRLARGGVAVIRAGATLPPALQARLPSADTCWTFITAWNPRSSTLPRQDNRQRQRRLLARLRQLVPRATVTAGAGVARGRKDGPRWREPSLFVVGITPGVVDALMREFEQHAAVCGTGSRPAHLRWGSP